MLLIALKMLIGDRAKYLGIVMGLSFAFFIITQQAAILVGIIDRTFGFITDVTQPNIWVMDPTVQYIDDIKPMKDTDVYRVRSVDGVEWAVPLYRGLIQARRTNGVFQTCVMVGIDDFSLIGAPSIMVQGKVEDLRIDNSVIVSDVGAKTKLAGPAGNYGNVALRTGDVLELNDNRAIVVGICKVSRTFQSQPVLYTTYNRATYFVPSQRKLMSFVIAKSAPGLNPEDVCARIQSVTGFAAYTPEQLKQLTTVYYAKYTSIFVNFGVAILLGFIIGTSIAGQTLFTFTMDKLPYFGVFKAMGADNATLTKMVLLQALFVSAIGWGIGIGAASLFGYLTQGTELSFSMPAWLYLGSGASILFISLLSAFICVQKVLKVDPAIVFKS